MCVVVYVKNAQEHTHTCLLRSVRVLYKNRKEAAHIDLHVHVPMCSGGAIRVSCMSIYVGSLLFRFDVELRYTGRDRRLLRATQGFEKKAGWDRIL